MGLDMYLAGNKFLWTDSSMSEGQPSRKQVGVLFPNIKAEPSGVEFELGYWRKANAIHNWFVTNVQNGVDDCGEYTVGKEQLLELKTVCMLALEDKNSDILPPQGGFFFGSIEKDNWYYESIEHTIKIVDTAIDFIENHGSVSYHSSW